MTKPFRVAAWLLTPLVVWVGAFSGGWLGALTGGTLAWLAAGGAVGGMAAAIAWSVFVLYRKKRSAEAATDDRAERS